MTQPAGKPAPASRGDRPWRAWIVRRTPERWAGPVAMAPSGEARAFGLTAEERLVRACRRAGASQVASIGGDDPTPPASAAEGTLDVCFRADCFYDERVVAGMADQPGSLLEVADLGGVATCSSASALASSIAALRGDADVEAGCGELRTLAIEQVAPSYNPALRKRDPPFVYPARVDQARQTEDRIFSASYKGITDFVTKWVFPRPAKAVTRWLAARGTRPNTVTAWSYALVGVTTLAFASGWFGLGLAVGWLMTFLDTVDGKLARCTLTSSRIGHILDHGLDLVHPPIWWLAFAWGLAQGPPAIGNFAVPTVIILGGYLLGRGLEGVFLLAFRQEIFTWRPFDGFFRQIIARRNPNLLLLSAGTLAGRPDLGFAAVAGWTLICVGVHILRLGQAFAARQQGQVIRPWTEEAEASEK